MCGSDKPHLMPKAFLTPDWARRDLQVRHLDVFVILQMSTHLGSIELSIGLY
jgi:hypothetical protein